MQKNQKHSTIHVGQMVKDVYNRLPREFTVAKLAAELHCDRTNIYDIFRRPSIDTHLLIRLSEILQHDFFTDISTMIFLNK